MLDARFGGARMSLRAAVMTLTVCAVAFATQALAGANYKWRWDVVEKDMYVAQGSGLLTMSIAVSPEVVEWPTRTNGPSPEARERLLVTGLPPSRSISVTGVLGCEDEYETTSSSHTYSFKVRPGVSHLLPASTLKPAAEKGKFATATNVNCAWALRLTAPLTGDGVHRVSVALSIFSPANVVPVPGGLYEPEQCVIEVDTSSNQRSCEPIPPGP